jgi:hypothetical protein
MNTAGKGPSARPARFPIPFQVPYSLARELPPADAD